MPDDFEKYTKDFDSFWRITKATKLSNERIRRGLDPSHHFENAKKERERQKREIDEQRNSGCAEKGQEFI